MPTRRAYEAVLKFAQTRGALTPHAAGYLSSYLGPLMEIKYLCRMRSIEVLHLTDAHASELGVHVARCKRSHDQHRPMVTAGFGQPAMPLWRQ